MSLATAAIAAPYVVEGVKTTGQVASKALRVWLPWTAVVIAVILIIVALALIVAGKGSKKTHKWLLISGGIIGVAGGAVLWLGKAKKE